MRWPAIPAAVLLVAAPTASVAQSETTSYDLIGGYVIDLPTTSTVFPDFTMSETRTEEGLLMLVILGPVAPADLSDGGLVLAIDAAPNLDRDFISLSGLPDADLLPGLAASLDLPPERVDLWGAPLTFGVTRGEGHLRVSATFSASSDSLEPDLPGRELNAEILVFLRPTGSFWLYGFHNAGSIQGEALRETMASVRPGP